MYVLKPSLCTDVVLFFFSFFLKTSASAWSECEAREQAWSTRKKIFPHIYPFALAVNKSHVVYIFSDTCSMDFEAKTSFGQSNTIKN